MALPHEEKPLGPADPARPARASRSRPSRPTSAARALSVASRLLAGATTFFFLAYVFAYFYLRSIDSAHVVARPACRTSTQALGVAFAVCIAR